MPKKIKKNDKTEKPEIKKTEETTEVKTWKEMSPSEKMTLYNENRDLADAMKAGLTLEEYNKQEAKVSDNQIDIGEIISILVPPDEIEVIDIYGNVYKKPSFVSARTQIKIIQKFEDTIENIDKELLIQPAEGVAGFVGLLLNLASDENVLEGLGQCFVIAHPKIVKQAVKAGKAAGENFTDPVDLFSLEEIANAIVPLFIRLAQKTGKAIAKVSQVMEKQS